MDAEVTNTYHSFTDDNDEDSCIRNDFENDSTEAQIGNSLPGNFYIPPMQLIKTSFQLSVLCGILFGLFSILLWWIELNVKGYCIGQWDDIPNGIHRFRLLVETVEGMMISMWPVMAIAPICSWSMITESNILFWCTIAALVGVIDRFSFYIFGYYEAHSKSYVANVVFLFLSFIVFYKFARHRQQPSNNKQHTVIITLKIILQLIFGLMIYLPYNYILLTMYRNSPPFIRTILSCTLIAVLYVPKLIISFVIPNIHCIFEPKESIVFAAGFLVISTMITRLTQAEVESLSNFTIISLVHGLVNVLDKLALPLRRKIFNWICRRDSAVMNESWVYTQHYIAHQSLISIITETSSVIMSNAAAFFVLYYYKEEGNSGKKYGLLSLFKAILIRSSIAVFIEWVFNVVALKVQCDRNIPVVRIWKIRWKFIMVIHLIQVIYVFVYFAHYVDAMLLNDVFHNSTAHCFGLFTRL